MTDLPDLTEISPTHLTCGNCGADVGSGDVLCASCGALLAAYQAPSGSSATSAATTSTTTETSMLASDGASTSASTSISSVNTGQRDLYPAPASPARPEITTTMPPLPGEGAKPVARATNPGNSAPAPTTTTTPSAPRVIFPAPGARSVSEPEGAISPTSASSPAQLQPPPQRSAPRDRDQSRSNSAVPEDSRTPQPVRQPVITNNEPPELPANGLPRRELVPPVRLPRFSGRQLGQVVPFALIALVIITRVRGMTALLGLLAVVGIAGLFLYGVLRVTRGTRRRTTDMPHDRDYYRNRHRRRRGR